VVGSAKGHRHATADRAEEDDPAAGAANQRQHRLRHRDLRDQVDLELFAQVIERDRLQRRHHRHPSVVDQAVQTASAHHPADLLGHCGDLVRLGHVEHQRHEPLRRSIAQACGVLLAANAGEDPPALGVHPQGGRPADSGRGAGD
jgi:hypothetical protein